MNPAREARERIAALEGQLAIANALLSEAKIREQMNNGLNLRCVESSEQRDERAFGQACVNFAISTLGDDSIRLEALKLACKLNNPLAKYRLGKMYLSTDPTKALELFFAARASSDGPIGVFEVIGRCYEYGLGVPVDLAKAVEEYTKGAAFNHCLAELALGRCYLNGTGVEVNRRLGWSYIERAAEHGSPVAREMLKK